MSGYFLTPLRGSISPSRYTYTETPIKEAPLELCKAVANIFKTIAEKQAEREEEAARVAATVKFAHWLQEGPAKGLRRQHRFSRTADG